MGELWSAGFCQSTSINGRTGSHLFGLSMGLVLYLALREFKVRNWHLKIS
jgi:hypothetical protein